MRLFSLLRSVLTLAACSSSRSDRAPVRVDSLHAEPGPVGSSEDG